MINAIDISIPSSWSSWASLVDPDEQGASSAFSRWAKGREDPLGAQLLTMLLGVLIFIDDYFNCLTVGAVMRPVTKLQDLAPSWLTSSMPPPLPFVCWLPCPLGPPPLHPTCRWLPPAPVSS
ncbi:MAG: hypothetical protein ACLTGT_07285 [Oscillospiraceae bacterium]